MDTTTLDRFIFKSGASLILRRGEEYSLNARRNGLSINQSGITVAAELGAGPLPVIHFEGDPYCSLFNVSGAGSGFILHEVAINMGTGTDAKYRIGVDLHSGVSNVEISGNTVIGGGNFLDASDGNTQNVRVADNRQPDKINGYFIYAGCAHGTNVGWAVTHNYANGSLNAHLVRAYAMIGWTFGGNFWDNRYSLTVPNLGKNALNLKSGDGVIVDGDKSLGRNYFGPLTLVAEDSYRLKNLVVRNTSFGRGCITLEPGLIDAQFLDCVVDSDDTEGIIRQEWPYSGSTKQSPSASFTNVHATRPATAGKAPFITPGHWKFSGCTLNGVPTP